MADVAAEAVEQAGVESQADESVETNPPEAGGGEESLSSPQASPTGSSHTAPPPSNGITREDLLAMQRDNIARLDQIKADFAKGSPQAQAAAQASGISADDEAFHAKYLRTPAGWAAYCKELQQDPSLYERSIQTVVNRARHQDFAAIKQMQADFKAYRDQTEKELAEQRGWRRLSEHRFSESAKWKQHGKAVLASFDEGLFNASHEKAIEKAFEYHERLAKAQGATPQQAAAAGAQAAQAKGAQIAAGKGGKPEPRDEATLRTGDKRSPSGPKEAPKSAKNDKNWLNSIAARAVEQSFNSSKR